MGIGNRDYMREERRFSFSPMSSGGGWGAVEALIAINVVMFLALTLTKDAPIWGLLMASMPGLQAGHVWTLVTYAFLHGGIFHIFFNMYILWAFGRSLERSWGTRSFLLVYFLGAASGGLVHCLLSLVGWPDSFVLGASGATTAIVLAYALLNPTATLILLVIPMRATIFALVIVGFDVWGLISQYGNPRGSNIGHGAHLGGALVGYLYVAIRNGRLALPWAGRRRRRSSSRSHSRGREFEAPPPPPRASRKDEKRMDELLEKVAKGGLDSLSSEERDFMMNMSRKYKR